MSEFIWNGDLVMQRLEEAGTQALKEVAQNLKAKSISQAPIDTGDLRSNCAVSDVVNNPQGKQIKVGYSLPYALKQHEHTEYRHPQGGKAKYLEDPFKSNAGEYERYIKDKVNQAII